MLSFIQMAAALSGAGNGEESLVVEKESPPGRSSTEPSEVSNASEATIPNNVTDGGDVTTQSRSDSQLTDTSAVLKSDPEGDLNTDQTHAAQHSRINDLKNGLSDADLSREGSVDLDSLVHAQIERGVDLSPSPNEKSWDEELREALKEDRDLQELGICDEDDNNKDIDQEKDADAFTHTENPNDNTDAIISERANVTECNAIEINVVTSDKVESVTEDMTAVLDAGLMMTPGTRDGTDGSVSPSLMFASCRFRWEKMIITQSQTVVFVTINKKEIEPIKLSWSDSSKCYYSEEFKIPVGTYVGNLVVDGNFYPMEDITIKHYTFEVDLYLKEEIIEDEQDKTNGVSQEERIVQQNQQHNGSNPSLSDKNARSTESFDYTANRDYNSSYSASRARMDSDRDSLASSLKSEASGINLSSKYQELIRSQMSGKNSFLDQDSDNELGFSIKSDHSDLADGRRTPVGEDGAKQYQDGDDAALKKLDIGNIYRSIDERTSLKDTDLVTSGFENKDVANSIHSNRSSARNTPSSMIIDDVLGNGHSRTPIYSTEPPVHSKNNSAHSSARQTPVSETRDQARPGSVNSVTSANSVSRHLIDDMLDSALVGADRVSPKVEAKQELKEGSRCGSTTKTPPPEQIDDVLNPSDRHSPIRREYLNGSPHTSNYSPHNSAHNSQPGSANNSQRQTPQKEMISDILQTSQEKLYSSQEIRKLSYSDHGSPHSSHHSSHHSSQHSSHHSASSSSTLSSRPQSLTSEQELTQYYENGTETTPKLTLPTDTTAAQKSSSAASLPVIGSQRYTPEKRSMTPDNHIRIPGTGSILKGPLLPGRTTPRTPLSNASSRTVTPVNVQNEGHDVKVQEQIKDLENTVSSLRRLLASSEQEVVEVKGQYEEVRGLNQKLQGDVDRLRARASPGPQIAELERKNQEVCDERDRLNSMVELLREDLRSKEQPSLNSYDPNSPAALKRKIGDLTSQIQDLQEAHETSVAKLSAAEKKVKELAEENELLRIAQDGSRRDVEEDNRFLKNEVARLKDNRSTFNEATEHRLKIELQQIKDDNRSLRERNYTLHDDNLKLREEIMNLRKSFELMDSGKKSFKEEKKSRKTVEDYIREDRNKLLESSYQGDSGSHGYRLSDPLSSYSRNDQLPLADEKETTYTYTNSTYNKSQHYDSHTDSMKVEQTYDLDNDLMRRSTADHLSRSDGGRYQKSSSYGGLDTDRLAQSESVRYNSDYRSMPDGGAADRLRPSPPKYEPRPRTPERSSTLTSSKKDITHNSQLDRMKYERLDRGDLDLGRKERSRTTSADIDYRSMPAYNSDLPKTIPTLSGRSKEIYEEITDKRLKERTQLHSTSASKPVSKSELDEGTEDPSKTEQSPANAPATSAQVFVNRHIPQNSKEPTPPTHSQSTDERKLLSLESELAYSRTAPQLPSHTRHLEREEKDYEVRGSLYQDDGEMSDTATDILVNAQPLDKIPGTWNKNRNRRGSLGSDGSDFSDIDEQLSSAIRKRSKSADGREILRRMAPTGSSNTRGRQTSPGKGDSRPLSRTLSPGASTAGFRSITPRPLATQHNKTSLSLASSMNTLTQGLRPFAPRSPQDLQVNDVIKFSRQGGKLSQGMIKFIGHLPGRGDIYLGVELDKEDGKHDGIFEGVRYFKCKPNKGVFVAYNKVVMAWTTY